MLNFIKDLFKRTPRLTKEEIINETIEFYSADTTRRSVNPDNDSKGCAYNHANGNHCAVGRLMLPEYKKLGTKLTGNNETVEVFIKELKVKSLDKVLLPQYRGHELSFWRKLQVLHDRGYHWQENDLTTKGLEYANALIEHYKSN